MKPLPAQPSGMTNCVPFLDESPSMVQIFKMDEAKPIVTRFQGHPSDLEEIREEYLEQEDDYSDLFPHGQGDYLFLVNHEPGQQSFPETGRWDFEPYFELELVGFKPWKMED